MSDSGIQPWRVCKRLIVDTVEGFKEGYPYFAEDKSSEMVEYRSLSLEFYAHELQKVDTSNRDSIHSFCEEYGLLFSPMYSSKRRSLDYRQDGRGRLAALNELLPYETATGSIDETLSLAVADFKSTGGLGADKPAKDTSIVDARSDGSSSGSRDLIAAMFRGSEYARSAQYANSNLGAIVGVDELAITIRQLQMSMMLLSAYEAGLRRNELIDYLYNRRVLQQHYPRQLPCDLFVEPAFSGVRPQKVTSEIVKSTAASAPDGSDFSNDPEALAQIEKGMGFYLNSGFDEAYQSAASFIQKATRSLDLQNAGFSAPLQWADSGYNPALVKPPMYDEGSLLEAILVNFQFVRESKQEWHRCKYSGCGRVFKFQKEYDPSKRFRQADYCKNGCRVMDGRN